MKPAIFSCHLFKDGAYATKEEAVRHASSVGIEGVEAGSTDLNVFPLADMQNLLEAHGMFVNSLNLITSFPDRDEAVYRKELDEAKRLIDEAERVGANFAMVVPFSEYVANAEDKLFARERIITGMSELIEYTKDANITITMENFSFRKFPYSTIEEMKYLLETIPGLKYTYDSGNFFCMQNDAIEAYETLKPYIVNVHMKDWQYDYFGRFVRPNMESFVGAGIGQGVLPLAELRAHLAADGYEGQAAIEFNAVHVTPQVIKESAEFILGKR